MISLFLCGLSFFHTKERVALMVSLGPGVPFLLTWEIWFFSLFLKPQFVRKSCRAAGPQLPGHVFLERIRSIQDRQNGPEMAAGTSWGRQTGRQSILFSHMESRNCLLGLLEIIPI